MEFLSAAVAYNQWMPVSVVHISDLHRDAGSHITTAALLESLRRDRDRYMSDGSIPKPALVVVSGDIVYGVTTTDYGSDARLKEQYKEAHEFLVRLAEAFFSGDRDRVVVVPGNHDISLPHVMRSTEVVDFPMSSDARALLGQQFAQDGTPLRWSWNDLSMRRIADVDEYNRRLLPYAEFYDNFYQGRRAFSLDPAKQFAIHDFPELRLVFAALSSCHENDPFNRTGRIHPECIAGATREVAEYTRRGRLAIAVWHHSIQGGPKVSDYVDADMLQSLMDGGFVLALHGHQHRPQLVEHRFTADRKRNIVVLSAGTLCGGPRTLPSGRMRAYNVLVIDPESRQCAMHVRDMQNADFSLPVWGDAHVVEFSGSSITFPLTPSTARHDTLIQVVAEADRLLRMGGAKEAYRLVQPHIDDTLARRLAVHALAELQDWNELVVVIDAPTSPEEFIVLCDSLYELGRRDDLAKLLGSWFAMNSKDLGVVQSVALWRSRLGGR